MSDVATEPSPATQRYKAIVSYRGTRYHGWQTQPAAPNWKGPAPPEGHGLPTVQETLTRALGVVLGQEIAIIGASRTDTGVHAKGQVIHFDTTRSQIPPHSMRYAVNAKLPDDIIIRRIAPTPPEFHAIKAAVCKRYQYFIWNDSDRPVFFADLAWHRWQQLRIDAMREAAAPLVGRHDFAAFAKPGHGRQHTVRTIHAIDIELRGARLVIGVCGKGFLWNQVRIIVGTLVEVGIGRRAAATVREALESKDRRLAGPTAPAHGLYLQWIRTAEEPPRPDEPSEVDADPPAEDPSSTPEPDVEASAEGE